VRSGEPYDGRAPERDRYLPARLLPRAALFLPRVAADLLLRITIATVDFLERSGALALGRRIFWAWDGRLRVLPEGGWRSDLTPTVGAVLATDLLYGPSRRAGLVARGYAGARQVFGASLGLGLLGLRLPGSAPLPGRVSLDLRGGYDRRADLPFYGLGRQETLGGALAMPSRLGRELAWADLLFELRLWRSLRLGLRAGLDWRRSSDGLALSGDDEPISRVYGTDFVAFGEPIWAFAGGLRLSVGEAMGELLPEAGWRGAAAATALAGAEGFSRILLLEAHLEAFAGLGMGAQRLGLRGLVAGLGGLGGEEVPLPHLPSLGGLTTMRGFPAGRFQGETLAWIALEHYAALHPRLWLCLFVEWGAAWREAFSEGAPRQWANLSGGGWLGLLVAPGLWLQLQAAGSREGPQLFVGVRTEP
jgi:hypothetical protein